MGICDRYELFYAFLYLLWGNASESVVLLDSKILGRERIGVTLQSLFLSVDCSELFSGHFCVTESVTSFGIAAEDEDDVLFGTYETLVESFSID